MVDVQRRGKLEDRDKNGDIAGGKSLEPSTEREPPTVFLAIRDIRFAKGRFALMGSVVALITLLLVMLSGLTAGLGDQSTSALKNLGSATTPVDSIAFGAASGNEPKASFTESQVSAEQVEAWSTSPGVASAEAIGITQTRLTGSAAGSETSSGTTNVAVFGVPAGSSLAPAPVEEGKVVIGESVAKDLALEQGDTISMAGVDLVVGGIEADNWYSHTSVLYTDLGSWAKLAHLGDTSQAGTVIAITNQDGATVDTEAANAAAETLSTTRTGSYAALGSYKSENGSLLMMQGFLYGISALVILAFLTVWTVQRTRDIAVLKALGGSGSYVLKDAITQASIVLLLGAGIGGGIGIIGGFFAANAAPFLVSPATTVLPIVGVVVLGLAGAALAVSRVTKVDALIALGGN
ncbi:ABC transporter permease [Paeniglutamicibacter gangotriensis Lz1y]|uniref:ABC transporter permease n=1 Tax=Paeniglutamicibacter gangotriensis Lz1y TaxID=1276920 RepID=M7N580_9MICC|nr:ABC transporter permease [Paeniglutamicibacter gangotriensis Lz1y]